MRTDRLDDIQTSLDALAAGDLRPAIEQTRETLGFANVSFLGLPASEGHAGVIAQNTYSREWAERYAAEDYILVDPVVHEAPRRIMPSHWHEFERRGRVRQLFAEARMAGVGERGVTIPLRSHGGDTALFSVSGEGAEATWTGQVRESLPHLLLIGHTLFEHVEKRRGRTVPYTLGPREREVLLWAARGKTAEDTADILNIATPTVRHYLGQARAKLNALTIAHAVARALVHGLIPLPE